MKTIAFFNNKGGVGKTTLVYHLAWMFNELGVPVVALDLDPQANLTTAFLREERLAELWIEPGGPTIFRAVEPLLEHLGDLAEPPVETFSLNLALVPGDLALARFEDRLAEAWPKCSSGVADAFRVTSAFYRVAVKAAQVRQAALVLIDVGPSLGALTRAALIASDFVVVPLAADLYSLQGLRNLGPTLETWGREWGGRRGQAPKEVTPLPGGEMTPAGYVLLQHAVRKDRPVKAYERWADRVPQTYAEEISQRLGVSGPGPGGGDPCLATLKHYRSLMPLAQDAGKPMFLLQAADGAIGGHAAAVADCYRDFAALAHRIVVACGLDEEEPASE